MSAKPAIPPMPATDDRQPDDTLPAGYMESTFDWVRRNQEAAEWFIEHHRSIRVAMQLGSKPTFGR
jgi:hypothetical protein